MFTAFAFVFAVCSADAELVTECSFQVVPQWYESKENCELDNSAEFIEWADRNNKQIINSGCVPVKLPVVWDDNKA